jgi:hypothetical protein
VKALAENDPTDLKVTTPVRVEQGLDDTTVLPQFTTAMVDGLRKRGAKVSYKLRDDLTHVSIAFGQPQDEVFAWVSKRLR